MSETLPTRPGSAVREIDRAALHARLAQRESFKLVMASSDWGFRAKHIPGSVHFKNIAELLEAVAKDDDVVVCGPWLAGDVSWRLPALASSDLVFAALFVDYLRRTR